MFENRAAVTHRRELLAALGPSGPDIRQLADMGERNFNKAVDEAVWSAITRRQIVGRLALRYVQGYDFLLHGTPKTFDEIGGVLQPSTPCRLDSKGRAYPMGAAAVCASKGDIEQPIRKALLNHTRPELKDVPVVLWRRKDATGRTWHFTSREALTRLQGIDATGMVAFWEDYNQTPPFLDEATGELYLNERWTPHEVRIQPGYWTTVSVEDLALDYPSRVPHPREDLFIVDAPDQDTLKYLQLLPTADNFIQLADEMGIEVTPLSGYYPSELRV